MNTIVEVSNLTKAYKLYSKKSDRLREALDFSGKQYHTPFYALNDVSFAIEKGETIGILGTNGSGKSTLLKILSGVVAPTSGSVMVNGKISALLELGAGFNPEYTGLENIALHGTMMGYSSEEMEKKAEEIIRFADIGEYITQPVKTYSSGMFARLAFAAAINVEPEVLIVDEVLSVGDLRFQIKCMNQMKKMMENGTTILYVSHDISSVRRFCRRSLWLNKGQLMAAGETNEVADQYEDYLRCLDANLVSVSIPSPSPAEEEEIPFEAKSGEIANIVNFKVTDQHGNVVHEINNLTPIEVEVTYDVYDTQVEAPVLGVALFSIDDDYVCGLNTLLDHVTIPWKYGRNRFTLHYPEGIRVLGGKYYFDSALRDQTATVNICYKKQIWDMTVNSSYIAEGRFVLPHRWGR